MSMIMPFQITAAGETNQATAYWRSLCCAAGYADDNGVSLTALAMLVGATSVQQVMFPLPLPETVYLIQFSGGVMVLTNGTTAPAQYLAQVIGALLQANPYGAGSVNSYDLIAALTILNTLGPLLNVIMPAQIVYVGHSLGGAVSQIIAQRPQAWPVIGVWTAGQPRVGDSVWALAYAIASERYTTPGDPVPLVPPSANDLVDFTLQVIWPFLPHSYRHSGTRRHVRPDGVIVSPPEMPSWIEGTDYLREVVLGDTGWYAAHSPATYAARIRQGIPVAWLGSDADWPLIGQLDVLAAPLLGLNAGVPSAELFTNTSALAGSVNQYAIQGICR